LRVPAASVGLYKASDVWKKFNNIEGIDVIALDYSSICLLAGAEKNLSATLDERLPETPFDWTSKNPAAATINPDGKVTAIKQGTTEITVTAFGNEAICTVTVIQPGNSTISGTIDNSGTSNVRVNLYMKPPESDTKKGIIGGYVLLATVIPNDDGGYSFEDLPEGEYQVEVETDEYESEATDNFPLSGNESLAEVNFTIDDEGKIIAGEVIVHPVVTGAVETLRATSLQIYPNPFTDAVRITGKIGETGKIQVINTAGMIVHTQTIASPDETIHLGHLPAGLYIIRLENGSRVKTMKIIKISVF
jgi:hypothetical protein